MTVYTKPIRVGADWSARPIGGLKVKNTRVSYTWFKKQNNQDATVSDQDNLSFVLRYADFDGQRLSYMSKAEHDDFVANGVTPYLIYQKLTTDPNGGAAAGQRFGAEAVAYAKKIGYRTGAPIFFTADAPIGSYNLTTAVAFFRAATTVVRAAGYLGGVYGFRDVVYACQDAGVGDVYWLCGAESGMREGIHLYQWNNGRIYPDGVEADLVKQFMEVEDMGMTAEERELVDSIKDDVRMIRNFMMVTAEAPINPADGDHETFHDAVWQAAAEEKQRDAKNLQVIVDKLNSMGSGSGGALTKDDVKSAVATAVRDELLKMRLTTQTSFPQSQ